MPLLSLLQAITNYEPIALAGPYIISGGALLTGVAALWKVAFHAGKFDQFKVNVEQSERERRSGDSSIVRQHELTRLGEHIDRRFDTVERQLSDMRAGRERRNEAQHGG
jgi:hypothetical protein